jgi:hypothetical protein
MKKENITRFTLDPKNPPHTDWGSFDALSEKKRHEAAWVYLFGEPDATRVEHTG